MGIEDALSLKSRHELKKKLLAADEKLIHEIPKVELHVHIEGTLTLERRWKLTQRNGTPLKLVPNGPELKSLEELEAALEAIMPEAGRMDNEQETDIFFESYYQGFQALKTKEDFYDLAMDYFERVASMNVRYCEPFFDPQGHTGRGVPWNDMMDGFRKAQKEAESKLNVPSPPLDDRNPEAYCPIGQVKMDHVLPPGPTSRVGPGALQGCAAISRYDRRHRA
jgi:adenosine deaminase